MSFELAIAILGGVGGVYGTIQSWLTQRKMRQVEKERLTTRLDLDFQYSTIATSDYKLLHGIVLLENKGETNLKIIRLNIDGRDRSSEFFMSYLSDKTNSSSTFTPLKEQVTSLDLVALNNYKQVNFSNSEDKRAFRIFQPDIIYAREIEPKLREVEDVKGNIEKYSLETMEKIRAILEEKAEPDIEPELSTYLFQQIINKELRGLQVFPNAILKQEFLVKYQGSGLLYLNVETATLRVLQESINYVEQYKVLADHLLRTKELGAELTEQMISALRKIVTPESYDIHKQKESFLIYLE